MKFRIPCSSATKNAVLLSLLPVLSLYLPSRSSANIGAPAQVVSSLSAFSVPNVPTVEHQYIGMCRDLKTLAYWATFNVWVDRQRVHRGPAKRRLEAARRRVRAIKDMPSKNIAIVQETADTAFGIAGSAVYHRNIWEAKQNAEVTSTDVYKECIENKGVLTD